MISKERLEKYNELFDESKNKYENMKKSYNIINGQVPVLISAPHSVSQIRNGKIKHKDIYTGPIALEVSRQTNCYCIYKLYNNNDDANYDTENNEYKKEVLKLVKQNNIQLFIDIHGAKDNDEFEIDIGTDNYRNLNNKEYVVHDFINICNQKTIDRIGIDKKFKANTIHTITKTVASETDIPCMQIEITKKYRDIFRFDKMETIIQCLVEQINQFRLGRGRYEL